MPGWYVHMESAHEAADRLRAGAVPAGFPISVVEAEELGEICHTRRGSCASSTSETSPPRRSHSGSAAPEEPSTPLRFTLVDPKNRLVGGYTVVIS